MPRLIVAVSGAALVLALLPPTNAFATAQGNDGGVTFDPGTGERTPYVKSRDRSSVHTRVPGSGGSDPSGGTRAPNAGTGAGSGGGSSDSGCGKPQTAARYLDPGTGITDVKYGLYCPPTSSSGGGGGAGGPVITTRQLSQQALALLPLPDPKIKTAPPRHTKALVQMPQWFWLAKSQWHSRSKSAKAGDASAEVTAKPAKMTIDPGDGSGEFTCKPPWTPYRPDAEPTCTHTYTRHGHYTVTVTVSWSASWTGSDGDGGDLPALARSTSFRLTVVQARSQLITNP